MGIPAIISCSEIEFQALADSCAKSRQQDRYQEKDAFHALFMIFFCFILNIVGLKKRQGLADLFIKAGFIYADYPGTAGLGLAQ